MTADGTAVWTVYRVRDRGRRYTLRCATAAHAASLSGARVTAITEAR